MLGCKHEAEDAALDARIGVFREERVDRGVDAAEEQAADKLHRGVYVKIGNRALDAETYARQRYGSESGAKISLVLSEPAPSRGRDDAGEAAERENQAGDENDVWQVAGQRRDISCHDGLKDQDNHLHGRRGGKQRPQDGNFQQGEGTEGGLAFAVVWLLQRDRRFLDDENENDAVEHQRGRRDEK